MKLDELQAGAVYEGEPRRRQFCRRRRRVIAIENGCVIWEDLKKSSSSTVPEFLRWARGRVESLAPDRSTSADDAHTRIG